MSKLLFRLKNVPEDEAEEVRQLLQDNDIGFYETSAGNWGISMPALWLKDDDQLARATSLLEEYQRQRQIQARQNYQEQQQEGFHTGLWSSFKREPARFIAYALLIGTVIYLSLDFFLSF